MQCVINSTSKRVGQPKWYIVCLSLSLSQVRACRGGGVVVYWSSYILLLLSYYLGARHKGHEFFMTARQSATNGRAFVIRRGRSWPVACFHRLFEDFSLIAQIRTMIMIIIIIHSITTKTTTTIWIRVTRWRSNPFPGWRDSSTASSDIANICTMAAFFFQSWTIVQCDALFRIGHDIVMSIKAFLSFVHISSASA